MNEAAIEDTEIFVVKTTANQERSVTNLIEMMAKKENLAIRSILAPDELKGYILVEAESADMVEQAIQTLPHARSIIKGASTLKEVEHFLTPKTAVVGITEGSIVELITGPFKGEKARVKRVDET